MRKWSLVLALVFLGGVAGGAEPAKVQVIAHRGASAYAPENTLASFRKAAEMGADYFELDCRLSKDGEVIILHDADLERVTGVKSTAADLTLAEIQALDAGSWFSPEFKGEKIPTLREALAVATPSCGVYVEIKAEAGDSETSALLLKYCADQATLTRDLRSRLIAIASMTRSNSLALMRATVAILREMNMGRRVVIQSFSPLICLMARLEAPEFRTELLLSDDKDDPTHYDRLHAFALLAGLRGINVNKDSLSPERLAALRGEQRSVAVWTVNEKPDLQRFATAGVTAIITNFPDVCKQVLAEVPAK